MITLGGGPMLSGGAEATRLSKQSPLDTRV